METIEPNEDQFHSTSSDQEDQPSSPRSQEQPPIQEIQSSISESSVQEFTQPPALVCPHCSQEHHPGTQYCPLTGKPLEYESPPVGIQPAQGYTSPISQGYSQPQPGYPRGDQQPYYSPSYPTPYPVRPPKDRNIAILLEILPGLFGILGIGWIYSGKTSTGLAWLIGYLVWVVIVVVAAIISGFMACFCTVPINLVCVGISAYNLNNYTKSNPQLFGS
jgi:TM2 domain-containing membrane protein YozV